MSQNNHNNNKFNKQKQFEKKKQREEEEKREIHETLKKEYPDQYYLLDKNIANTYKLSELSKDIPIVEMRMQEQLNHLNVLRNYVVKLSSRVHHNKLINEAFRRRYEEENQRIKSTKDSRNRMIYPVRKIADYVKPVDTQIHMEPKSSLINKVFGKRTVDNDPTYYNTLALVNDIKDKVEDANIEYNKAIITSSSK